MTVVAYEQEAVERQDVAVVAYRFFDTGALDTLPIAEHLPEDVSTWPAPSDRPTTSETAAALDDRTSADPEPQLAEIELSDGLGL
jgi:hypothetical protein